MSTKLLIMSEHAAWPTPAPVEFFTFPGGEWSLRPTGEPVTFDDTDTLAVIMRGADPVDIVKAAIAAGWAATRGLRAVLALPYLPGARSDHDDVMGASTYASLINSMNFERVVTTDPHSRVAADFYDRLAAIDHTKWVLTAARIWGMDADGEITGIIAADKSGSSHAASIAHALGVPMFQALKHRDAATGKLTGFSVEPLPATGRLLVVDDICDGGGTFMGLAGVAGIPRGRLGLWVTHGIFSGAAASALPQAFSFVATTNSMTDHNVADFAHVIDITTALAVAAAKRG